MLATTAVNAPKVEPCAADRLRVLHLNAGNMYGGIERVLTTFAAERHRVPELIPEFGLCFPGRQRDELLDQGVAVNDLGAVRARYPWTVWSARHRLHQLLTTRRIDVVIMHGSWPHAVFAPVVRSAAVLLVMWFHNPPSGTHWLERWARQTPPDLAIANSHFTAEFIPNLYPELPSHSVIRNPHAFREQASLSNSRPQVREQLSTSENATVILQAIRLERWKGPTVLVEALGKLREAPGWVAWLAGGPQRESERQLFNDLRRSASTHGIADRVRFLGQRSDVDSLMAAADIYCQPNLEPEPFGMSFVEALAAGLPVVTSNIGGGAEIVDDSCGILAPPGDIAAVAGALQRLISDPKRRVALGAAGPARAKALCNPVNRLKDLQLALSSLIGCPSTV